MVKNERRLTLLCGMIVMLTAPTVNAEVILSSYNKQGPTAQNPGFQFSLANWEGFHFKTSDSAAYTLDSIKLRLASDSAAQVSVEIYRGEETCQNEPTPFCWTRPAKDGSVVSMSQTVTSLGDYVFNADNGALLAPSTTYWVIMKPEAPGKFLYYERLYDPLPGQGWSSLFWSETGAEIGDFYASPAPYFYCNNGLWTASCNEKAGERWWFHSGLNLFEINGRLQTASVVPEPNAGLLSFIGLIAMVGARRPWNRAKT